MYRQYKERKPRDCVEPQNAALSHSVNSVQKQCALFIIDFRKLKLHIYYVHEKTTKLQTNYKIKKKTFGMFV